MTESLNLNRYKACFDNYQKPLPKQYTEYGLCVIENDWYQENGLVIVGANPSVGEYESYTECSFYYRDCKGNHWTTTHQFEGAAYVDMFPVRQTKLREFEDYFRKNQTYNDLRADLLKVTHSRIAAMKPKVILNWYAMTNYYWGKDNSKDWLGYEFKTIDHIRDVEVCEITGNNNPININPEEILPNGTIVVFGKCPFPDRKQVVKPEDIVKIMKLR